MEFLSKYFAVLEEPMTKLESSNFDKCVNDCPQTETGCKTICRNVAKESIRNQGGQLFVPFKQSWVGGEPFQTNENGPKFPFFTDVFAGALQDPGKWSLHGAL